MKRLINFIWRVLRIPCEFVKCVFHYWGSECDMWEPPGKIGFKLAWGIAWIIHFKNLGHYLWLMWKTNCFEYFGIAE